MAKPRDIKASKPNSAMAEALANPTHPMLADKCLLARLIAEHANGEDIKRAVADPRWSAAQLSKALATFGVALSQHTITDHRGTRCICYRKVDKDV